MIFNLTIGLSVGVYRSTVRALYFLKSDQNIIMVFYGFNFILYDIIIYFVKL